MKKESFITTIVLLCLVSIILFDGCKIENTETAFLKKVLNKLEQIESVTYVSTVSAYMPWDSTPAFTAENFFKEYKNPMDSIVGSSFISFVGEEGSDNLGYTYDGNMSATVYHDIKRIQIDSFKVNKYPFRPISTPFFTRIRSLINYFLVTKDSLDIKTKDYGDSIQYSFIIYDDAIEIIGNQIVHDTLYESAKGKISRYDMWFNKQSNLPYKIIRDMPHEKSIEVCRNAEFNKIKLEDFRAVDYFPKGYEIRHKKQQKRNVKKNDMIGKIAPDWTLSDFNNNSFSLNELKSKVVMVEFTGIGCGPCKNSIPFLNELAQEYKLRDFDFVSIETWNKKIDGHRNYTNHYKINYKFLISNDEVKKSYEVSGVPVFFILDEKRIIRIVISGYAEGTTDKEIRDAISELLN